ncbi:helix-turn-helix domain-containing protein [Dyadobacter luticola]|uniref:Helix-turn-helix transcriptional regulator n=1 Tax=Dyadobacter luticola TaxID=1979387 RepID=A0A5R9KTN5_9BACT|nr:helix-turn-helix transcriptional regulator [Dyadobacter luticola]TLU99573.1 helix-turn-helix transcriptional regulator [Dyadobacter luticola]
MEIGEKIKKIRELKNYTQDYMAQKLEMTQAGYGKLERNESDLSYQKLEKIAEVLKVSVEDIINFNEKMIFNVMHNQTGNGYVVNNGLSEQERKLYEQIIQQQKEEIEFLRKFIDQFQSR